MHHIRPYTNHSTLSDRHINFFVCRFCCCSGCSPFKIINVIWTDSIHFVGFARFVCMIFLVRSCERACGFFSCLILLLSRLLSSFSRLLFCSTLFGRIKYGIVISFFELIKLQLGWSFFFFKCTYVTFVFFAEKMTMFVCDGETVICYAIHTFVVLFILSVFGVPLYVPSKSLSMCLLFALQSWT